MYNIHLYMSYIYISFTYIIPIYNIYLDPWWCTPPTKQHTSVSFPPLKRAGGFFHPPPSGGGDPRSEFEGCLTHLLTYQAGRTWQAPGEDVSDVTCWKLGKSGGGIYGRKTRKNEPFFCRWVFVHPLIFFKKGCCIFVLQFFFLVWMKFQK